MDDPLAPDKAHHLTGQVFETKSEKFSIFKYFLFSGQTIGPSVFSPNDARSNSVDIDVTSSDDDEYWFENADPKRPQIQAHVAKAVPSGHQRRIFHKLAPQVITRTRSDSFILLRVGD